LPKTKDQKPGSSTTKKKPAAEAKKVAAEPVRVVPEPRKPTQWTRDILSDEQVVELRAQLVLKRQRIVDLYTADVRAGQEATQEGTDDIVDRANNSYSRELMFSLSSAEREQLIEVDAALRRLDEGTYGYCQYSGKPIALARLHAVPWARYSIEYQELAEKGLLEEDGIH
jgi:DnaK suppressor protein